MKQELKDSDDDDSSTSSSEEERKLALLAATAGVLRQRERRNERRQRTRQYLSRNALVHPRSGCTSWQKLYQSRDDRAFITTMGVNVSTFDLLLERGFQVAWDTTPIPRNDLGSSGVVASHRRLLDAAGALGLYLHRVSSTMREVSLQQIFGLTNAVLSRYLAFAADLLLAVLRKMPEAAISWPRGEEFEEYSALIVRRHYLLDGAFGSIDGLNLPIQTSDDPEWENMTYNGWLHGHFCSSVLTFSSTGVVIACVLNAPGSWHDSRIARTIYERLLRDTPDSYYLVADTAFPRGPDSIDGRIQAPLKKDAILPNDPVEREHLERFHRQLLSYRQTAEWGMRTMQGSFGRLRLPLPVTDLQRRQGLLETCVRLFNLRARVVGISQILNTYVPLWKDDDEQLWTAFEEMLFPEIIRRDRVSKFHRSGQ
ncbi:hypothetical protein EXIGLDRAFT_738600 [Exidia glandulosa HHB12029]|uniref:DDE Tnp4 domain-containing protein n=1 Tax=Exidia glandulosa HHB12029 TaxID=1314781 RepID=A0A165NSM0_EXIGL|nr:hypothetical protein EXIGLDRAFT_738600 [Exidia glandulosa HHB12029]